MTAPANPAAAVLRARHVRCSLGRRARRRCGWDGQRRPVRVVGPRPALVRRRLACTSSAPGGDDGGGDKSPRQQRAPKTAAAEDEEEGTAPQSPRAHDLKTDTGGPLATTSSPPPDAGDAGAEGDGAPASGGGDASEEIEKKFRESLERLKAQGGGQESRWNLLLVLLVEHSFLPGTFAVVLAAVFNVSLWSGFHWTTDAVWYGLALAVPLAAVDMLLFLPTWDPLGEVEMRGSSMILDTGSRSGGGGVSGGSALGATGSTGPREAAHVGEGEGEGASNGTGVPDLPPRSVTRNPRFAAFRKGITLWQAERAKTNPGPMLGVLGEGLLIVASHFSESLFVCCQMHIVAEFVHSRIYEAAAIDSPNHWLWLEVLQKQHVLPMIDSDLERDAWSACATVAIFISVEVARRWKLLSGKVTPAVNVVKVNKITGQYEVESTNLGAALTSKELSASAQGSIAVAAAAQRWSKAINEGRDIFEGLLFAVAYTTSGYNIVPALAMSVTVDTIFSVWQRMTWERKMRRLGDKMSDLKDRLRRLKAEEGAVEPFPSSTAAGEAASSDGVHVDATGGGEPPDASDAGGTTGAAGAEEGDRKE